MNDCAILINSCDSYSDAWKPFFTIMKNSWPESCNFPIYLNTESRNYKDSYYNITILNVLPNKTSKIAWGERLIDALNRIKEKYIIFLLEDYFFDDKVDNDRINFCLEKIKKDELIASISLITTIDLKEKNSEHVYEGFLDFSKRRKHVLYTLNASPGIWNKNKLIKYTKVSDNPWIWERFGSYRTWFSKDIFYGKKASSPDIFSYDIKRGGAIHRGKWVGCTVKPLLEKNNITIDLNKRGVIEDWTIENPDMPKRNINTIVKNKYLTLLNIIEGINIKFFRDR